MKSSMELYFKKKEMERRILDRKLTKAKMALRQKGVDNGKHNHK